MPTMKTLKLGNVTYQIPISGGGSGMSAEAVQALLDCFAHVAWIGTDGQDYYDALYDALTAEPTPSATVTSITAVFTQGNNVVHEGDSLNTLKPYLTVTANYSDSTSETVTNYTLSGTLTVGTSTITVSYGGKTATFNVIVTQATTLSSITAVFTQGNNAIYTTDSLEVLKQYLTVTAHYSDSSTETVTNYTLSGTLTEGTSVITVSYGGKTATFNVTVSNSADRPLPSEYQEVEYIESDGNQYIDTGIYLDGSSYVKAKIAAVGTQSNNNYFGISNNTSGAAGAFAVVSFSSAGKLGFFVFGASVQAIPYDTNFHEYEMSADGVSVDGVSYQLSGTIDSVAIERTLYLFNYRAAHFTDNGIVERLGRIKVDDHTYIPCYRKADGEIGMYDTYSGSFKPNEGTGTFTKGVDVT